MIIEVVGKEIEKIKGDFESYLNGLNMVGEISYSQYSELYDEGTKQIQRAYELGKSDLEKENAELRAKESFVGDQNRKLCEQQQKIEVLEAENAKLKKFKRECETSLCRVEYQYNYEQLTKAKELLKQWLSLCGFKVEKLAKDTEQFLNSEVEK